MNMEWDLRINAIRNVASILKVENFATTPVYKIDESMVIVITKQFSVVFQIIIWPIVITGLISNIAVLCRLFSTSSKQNLILQPFYRCALFTFALSDLIILICSGMNTLSMVTSTTILWNYPDWTCQAIPYLQTVAFLVGSLTLAGIAVDRYIAIKPKPSRQQPRRYKWVHPALYMFFTWSFAAAASYLILEMYSIKLMYVIRGDVYYNAKICLVIDRAKVTYVYTSIFVLVFLPLATIFVVIHILLAININQRGKWDENSEPSSVSHDTRSTPVSHAMKILQNANKPPVPSPQRVLRKRRILKMILILIVVFGGCRLPLWIFLMCKLHLTRNASYWSFLQIAFTTMYLLNAAINPFLYTFLNEVVWFIRFLRSKCAS